MAMMARDSLSDSGTRMEIFGYAAIHGSMMLRKDIFMKNSETEAIADSITGLILVHKILINHLINKGVIDSNNLLNDIEPLLKILKASDCAKKVQDILTEIIDEIKKPALLV